MSGTSSSTNPNNTNQYDALPLGWTKIQRQRRRRRSHPTMSGDDSGERQSSSRNNIQRPNHDNNNNNDDDDNDNNSDAVGVYDGDVCCINGMCYSRNINQQQQQWKRPPHPEEYNPSNSWTLSSSSLRSLSTSSSPHSILCKGTVVICLPDMDPSWFQGYCQLDGYTKPWGLLGQQQPLDPCLQCTDGGYRQVTITLYPFFVDDNNTDENNHPPNIRSTTKPSHNKRNDRITDQDDDDNKFPLTTYSTSGYPLKDDGNRSNSSNTIILHNVEWTGGDMMRLHSDTISMVPHKIWSDVGAVPWVNRYFGHLVQTLRNRIEDHNADVLELMPHVAVIMGSIQMVLHHKPQGFSAIIE